MPKEAKESLLDEVEAMLSKMTPKDLQNSLQIMYGGRFDFFSHDPAEILLFFIRGLKKSGFFQFAKIIEGLRGRQ